MAPKLSKDISLEALVVEPLVSGLLVEFVSESRDSSVLPVVVDDPFGEDVRLDIDKGVLTLLVGSDLFAVDPCPTEILLTSVEALLVSLEGAADFPAIASNIELKVEVMDLGSAFWLFPPPDCKESDDLLFFSEFSTTLLGSLFTVESDDDGFSETTIESSLFNESISERIRDLSSFSMVFVNFLTEEDVLCFLS